MPQGFRTFQILLAVGFLMGFFVVLLVFVWKISELNVDLNRVSIATQVKGQLQALLVDGRACELNFSGLKLGEVPLSLAKVVDLRNQVVVRTEKLTQNPEVTLETLRLHLLNLNTEDVPANAKVDLEMIFSDRDSGRQSPLKVPIEAKGRVSDDREFHLETCRATFSDFAD